MTTPGAVTVDGIAAQVAPGVDFVTALGVTGITGAANPAMFAGATTSGAPASGTFAVGMWVIDYTGAVWVCTVAGTPGTWVRAGDGPSSGAKAPAVVALTDAATILVNAALGNDFRVTLAGNRTLGAPSNPVDGQRITFQVTQDGTGSRTLAYNAAYEFSTGLASPTLSTAAGKTDVLEFVYNATKTKWLLVNSVLGFA